MKETVKQAMLRIEREASKRSNRYAIDNAAFATSRGTMPQATKCGKCGNIEATTSCRYCGTSKIK